MELIIMKKTEGPLAAIVKYDVNSAWSEVLLSNADPFKLVSRNLYIQYYFKQKVWHNSRKVNW